MDKYCIIRYKNPVFNGNGLYSEIEFYTVNNYFQNSTEILSQMNFHKSLKLFNTEEECKLYIKKYMFIRSESYKINIIDIDEEDL